MELEKFKMKDSMKITTKNVIQLKEDIFLIKKEGEL